MPKKLNPRQEKFVAAYVKEGNATVAAEKAGYQGDRGTLASTGSDLLRNPNVRAELDKALERYSAAKVVERLGEQSEADIGEIVDINEGGGFSFNLQRAKELGLTKHIKKLKHDAETGAPIVEFYDAQAALKELARIHGLSKEDETAKGQTVNINVRAILGAMHPAAVAEFHRALLAANPDVVDAEPIDKS